MAGPFDLMDPRDLGGGNPYGGMGAYGGSPWSGVFDAIAGAGMGLMQASAPSAAPKDFGSLFGGLAGGAAMGMQNGEDKRLKRMLVGSQVALSQQKVKQLAEWQKLLSGGGDSSPTDAGSFPAGPTPLQADAGGDMAPFRAAIKGNESGGKYDAVGPVANDKGQRAYGAYQVMDFNVGPWTQEVLGKAMTPQEFLANPQAQDAVFDAKFGQSLKQYGNPQDAASVWFSGKPLAGNKSGPDVLGTTVPSYVAKFTQGLPPGPQMAQMPGPPQGLIPQGPPPAQMPGAPAGLIPPGPPMAPMPQVGGPPAPLNPMGPIAGGPQVAQGDGSGNPVQQAQYTPPQAAPAPPPAPPMAQPKSIQEVVRTIPPGVRQLIGAMGPEAGIKEILKYADPESVPAFDPRSGQMVFVPKTALRSGQYQPVDAATFGIAKQREAREGINSKVVQGPNGPQPNAPLLDYDKGVSAAQGTDPTSKMLIGDYDDARKANTEMQGSGLQARTGMAQTNRLGQLLDQVNTGRFTSSTQEIKQMAKGLGVNLEALGVKDDTAPAQAAQALTGQLALALRNPSQGAGMPGAMSDADRQFLTKMVPGLETTPEGRKLMVEYSTKMYQRQIEMAKIANDFMRSGEAKKDPNALYQKLQDYADKNPLFSEKDAPQPKKGSLPMPGKVRKFNPATGTLE